MELADKTIGIIGLGKRTGVVSAKVLTEIGAEIVISDVKSAEELEEEIGMLEGISSIEYDLGGHTEKVLNVDMIVVSPGVPLEIPILKEAKERGIEIISEIELSYRLSKAPFIAITGTNGKTTTTSLTGKLLSSYPGQVFVGGNIGRTLIGEVTNLTEDDLVVAEVSSFQLETIDEFHPEIAAFLNLTPDHLDRHKTLDAYLAAKMNIFKNQTENDYIILNADDKTLVEIADQIPSQIIWFSITDKKIPGVYLDDNKLICHLEEKQEIIGVDELKIRGDHNIENALASIAAAILKGIPISATRQELKEFTSQEHTLEYVTTHQGVQFYNDSKGTNPDASVKALTAFHEPVVLIAGGLSRGLDFTPFIEMIKSKVKDLVLIGETKEELKECAEEAGFAGRIDLVEDLEGAVKLGYQHSEKGDVVLFSPACASWDMFESYAQRGRLFKEYVRDIVNSG